MAKITLSTVKAFIRKNRAALYINVKSCFDGMTDGCESRRDGWQLATEDKTESKSSDYNDRTQGITGAWFVGSSRDYFTPYAGDGFTGIEITNSCGRFILAVKETVNH